MRTIRLLVSTAILAVAAFAGTGCCDAEKNQIKQLTTDQGVLLQQNNELKSQLALSRSNESNLAGQVDTLGMQLKAKDAELTAAKNKPAEIKEVEVNKGVTAAGWERGISGDKVTVGTDILFAPGKATLTPAGVTALNKIAGDIKKTYAGLPVRVYGYTDSDPIVKTKNLWEDNLDLSANRAMAVTRHLTAQGVRAEQIETVAMGDTHPEAANTSADGKKKNRRVEIVVLKNK